MTKMKLRKPSPKMDAAYFTAADKDNNGFDVKYINSDKGRGVFSCVHFDKGEFLLEYRGQLINNRECDQGQKLYHDSLKVFMFEFPFNGKLLWNKMVPLGDVNDGHITPNSKIKIISLEGKPHLCLFASRGIRPGEELTYNYGDSEFPWRSKLQVEQEEKEKVVYSKITKLKPEGTIKGKVWQACDPLPH
ncbi:hypothetical protein Q7C36_015289 [Tachysurus vachellii]|uniref:SET domain-containing protein n=1 Tax=Tachysurus vachellii TaxID=175792 RepID=A0AA88MBT8_TACVA|nr:hypothetical protein Q7C36_015289 [Tachysurus vachellii]